MTFVEKEMIIRRSGAGRIFVYREIHARRSRSCNIQNLKNFDTKEDLNED